MTKFTAQDVLTRADCDITQVRETTIYSSEIPILLRQIFQGRTVEQAADYLNIPFEQMQLMLEGRWRPTKAICKRLGLKVAYTLSGPVLPERADFRKFPKNIPLRADQRG